LVQVPRFRVLNRSRRIIFSQPILIPVSSRKSAYAGDREQFFESSPLERAPSAQLTLLIRFLDRLRDALRGPKSVQNRERERWLWRIAWIVSLVLLCGFLGLDEAYRSLANNINLYHKYPPWQLFAASGVWWRPMLCYPSRVISGRHSAHFPRSGWTKLSM